MITLFAGLAGLVVGVIAGCWVAEGDPYEAALRRFEDDTE